MRINNRTDFELVLSLKDNATQKIIPLPASRFKIELYTREAVSFAKRITIWSDDQNAKRSDDGLRLKVAVHVDDNLYLPNGTLMARFYFEQANTEYPDGVRHTQRPIDTGVIIWGGDSDLPSSVNVEMLTSYLKGDQGLSAYQLYKLHNPASTITEQEYADAPIKAAKKATKSSQLVIKEIVHEFVPMRPKGHTMWVCDDVSHLQVVGISPQRWAIEEKGDGFVFTDKEKFYSVPILDTDYIQEINYRLVYQSASESRYKRDNLSGVINLKINPEYFLQHSVVSLGLHTPNNGAHVTYEVAGKETNRDFEKADLLAADGWIRINIIGGSAMHIKILLDKEGGNYRRNIIHIGSNHEREILGTTAGIYSYDSIFTPPYVGRIKARDQITSTFPGESLFANIVNPKYFKTYITIDPLKWKDADGLIGFLGFQRAKFNNYKIFFRKRRKTSSNDAKESSGGWVVLSNFSELGKPCEQMDIHGAHSGNLCVQKVIIPDMGKYHRVQYVDCLVAKVKEFRTYSKADMAYPVLRFRLRAVLKKYTEPCLRGRAYNKCVWRAELL